MRPKKKICFHGNMVLVKLQKAYHMSVLGLTFSQARGPADDTVGWKYSDTRSVFYLFIYLIKCLNLTLMAAAIRGCEHLFIWNDIHVPKWDTGQ